jgi:formylglycine-generating enzyme required for sulfatase activity
MSTRLIVGVAAFAAVTGLAQSSAWAGITIPTVPIGNPGNAPDTRPRGDGRPGVLGSVAYAYNIGTTEVTNAQYAAFLNAKGVSNSDFIWNDRMGITRSGVAGSYSFSPVSGRANHPVNYVTFFHAARFVNWLHNGQGNGDTETGAYTLNGVYAPANVTRNAGWQWAVASEDEWYKAAYYQPAAQGGPASNYWWYTTASDTEPTTAQGNFSNVIGDTTPVGSYAPNFHGAFDMGGNVNEWTDTFFWDDPFRVRRGGNFLDAAFNLRSDLSADLNGSFASNFMGIRVVQVPGPSSVALLAIGGLVGARRRRG